MRFPNLTKGLRWGAAVGGAAGFMCFTLAAWLSTVPPATEVSLSLALRPWWHNWDLALFSALVAGLPAGLIAAFRPVKQ